jgi:diadenosine tetraphosphate (Ap4A) HIT family hydrolase
VKGEVDSAKIWENKEFLAILDINPNTKGVAVVLTKRHYPLYVFDLSDKFYTKIMIASKKVAKLLDKKLGVRRTAMVMEGLGINHVHIKLYPIHGLNKKFEETWTKKRIFFKKYKGYISTQLGPNVKINKLKKLANEIKH